jgi:hypothetical protein
MISRRKGFHLLQDGGLLKAAVASSNYFSVTFGLFLAISALNQIQIVCSLVSNDVIFR